MKLAQLVAVSIAVVSATASQAADYSGSPQMLRLEPMVGAASLLPTPDGHSSLPMLGQETPEVSQHQLVAAEESTGPILRPQATAQPTPAPLAEPGLMNQMLNESRQGTVPSYPAPALSGMDCGVSPEACASLPAPYCYSCPWRVSVAGLVMGRDRGSRVWTSRLTADPASRVLSTQDTDTDWTGGYEIRMARRLGDGPWSVEASYWALEGLSGYAAAIAPEGGSLSSLLDVAPLAFGDRTGPQLFDGAAHHVLARRNDFDSVELDLVHQGYAGENGLLAVSTSFGVRYVKFFEDLTFGSRTFDDVFGNDLSNEAFLRDRITNHLVGFQIGANASYSLGCNLRMFAAPRLGVYGNHIENRFVAYRGDGVVATIDPASGYAGTYPASRDKDVFSFLGEIDLGAEWQFHPQWTARLGYRLFAATGIGLADEQIPVEVAETAALGSIDSNSDLILHGAYAGLEFRF